MIRNVYPAEAAQLYIPDGCTPCDHREIPEKWTEDSSINIQNFAPMLPLMLNVEERPGFKNIGPNGDVLRMQPKPRGGAEGDSVDEEGETKGDATPPVPPPVPPSVPSCKNCGFQLKISGANVGCPECDKK